MSEELITWIWLLGGLFLMLIELFLPGLVVVFLGAAAVLVAGLRWSGIVEDLPASLGVWMALSVLLVLTIRKAARRWLPSESHRDLADEDADAFGEPVEVIEECSADAPTGRIRYQGTTWPAMTIEGRLLAGQKARLVYRDNIAWIVEPLPELEDPAAIREALERELRERSNKA